ncbi:NfeD family protein [Microcoleus sp. herbarium19]|uniref:NfeD family protein n=1 Tax=unclassified Microcoleus TaxID=2642155 RepID=UPI002FD6F2DE
MIQLKLPNLGARALAPFAQMLNGIAFGQAVSESHPVPDVDRTQNLEKQAIVDEEIPPYGVGRVRFQASWWPARCDRAVTLVRGEIVYVVGIDNITLLVEPLPRA